jgi:polyisoprenoid-binding protein YceI
MSSSPTVSLDTLTGDYNLDVSHSRIGFAVRHAMVAKVRGSFGEFKGSAHLDFSDASASTVRLAIKAASIDTGTPDRDAHLRSNDFFAMEQYPEISFASTAVESSGEATYRVEGDLTIKGVTKPVTLECEFLGSAVDPYGNTRVGFECSATIDRRDWGVTWNAVLDAGGVMVGEKVTLEIGASLIKAA